MSSRSRSPPSKRIKINSLSPRSVDKLQKDESLDEGETSDSEQQCSICLQAMKDRTVISTCSHEFCFECIVIWSEQSRRCPLCSQGVGQYVVHNIRSRYDFRKYYLAPLRTSPEPQPQVQAVFPRPGREERIRRRRIARPDNRAGYESESDKLERSIAKRKWVYRHGLYAKHVASNPHTKYRPYPTPAQFAASNELISKTTSFLRRELQVWDNLDISFLTAFIISLMKAIDIRSEPAVKLLAEFLDLDTSYVEGARHSNAEHFAHELYSFVRSPFRDIFVYDSVVQYDEPRIRSPGLRGRRWRAATPVRSRSCSPRSSERRLPENRSNCSPSRPPSAEIFGSGRNLGKMPNVSTSHHSSPHRKHGTESNCLDKPTAPSCRFSPDNNFHPGPEHEDSETPARNTISDHSVVSGPCGSTRTGQDKGCSANDHNHGDQASAPSDIEDVSALERRVRKRERSLRNRSLLDSVHAHLALAPRRLKQHPPQAESSHFSPAFSSREPSSELLPLHVSDLTGNSFLSSELAADSAQSNLNQAKPMIPAPDNSDRVQMYSIDARLDKSQAMTLRLAGVMPKENIADASFPFIPTYPENGQADINGKSQAPISDTKEFPALTAHSERPHNDLFTLGPQSALPLSHQSSHVQQFNSIDSVSIREIDGLAIAAPRPVTKIRNSRTNLLTKLEVERYQARNVVQNRRSPPPRQMAPLTALTESPSSGVDTTAIDDTLSIEAKLRKRAQLHARLAAERKVNRV